LSTSALVAGVLVVVALAAAAAQAAGPSINAGPQAGTVWERGLQTAAGRAAHTTSPNLIYHGGKVQTAPTAVQPIFWGTSWANYTGQQVDGVNLFYSSVGDSSYANTNQEYTQNNSASQTVSAGVTTSASVTDSSAAPTNAPQTSTILAEVAKLYPHPTANAYYPVYIDQPRGHTQYCAWHSAGTINGVNVQFGFFFKLDGDAGCDPQNPDSTWDEGTEAAVNVSGHELSEMMTDPQLNAWYDSKGAENADKCAWTFGAKPVSLGSGKTASSWKIQGNWSNNAYNAGRGYVDARKGQVVGCIDGTN
jgi:hypothetical protein